MVVVLCRHRRSNHGDRVSAKCLLHRCAGVEHILPVHVDDVTVAMVTLQQHLEHGQVADCSCCRSPVDLILIVSRVTEVIVELMEQKLLLTIDRRKSPSPNSAHFWRKICHYMVPGENGPLNVSG